ncbi:hypothetical protein AB0I81_40080 [Nonomuraea sp. NPDC050404]|uniref:hypothetical protein n=1 Tax=Nonomuraea sp. NPDC050404 TaxID=3155783 RepID=UPI0033D66B02
MITAEGTVGRWVPSWIVIRLAPVMLTSRRDDRARLVPISASRRRDALGRQPDEWRVEWHLKGGGCLCCR